MKKQLLLALLLLLGMSGQAQDLIFSTLKNQVYSDKQTKTTRAAELIASRKISDVDFIKKAPFKYTERAIEDYKNTLDYAVFLHLGEEGLQSLQAGDKDIYLNIPVSDNESFTLELTRVQVISDDFKVETASGTIQNAPIRFFYRGQIRGDDYSFAAISVFEGHIAGLIGDRRGNYALEKVRGKKEQYVFYNDQFLKTLDNRNCSTEDGKISKQAPSKEILNQFDPIANRCIKVYIECENALFINRGSIQATVEYVLALLHGSTTLYFNEDIDVQLSQIFIWDVADPYGAATSPVELKNAFKDERPNLPERIGHIITTRNIGGGNADRPENSHCSEDNIYAATANLLNPDRDTFPFPPLTSMEMENTSRDIRLFTHEIGHQLGSPHTHACAWGPNNDEPFDDCGNLTTLQPDGITGGCFDTLNCPVPNLPPPLGGTIMSYCHQPNFLDRCNPNNVQTVGTLFVNGFGSEPGDLLRSRVSAANCLTLGCDCTDFVNRVITSPNFSGVWEASNNIEANGTVDRPNHEPVIFRAGNQIELTNFTVDGSSTFIAEAGADICVFEDLSNINNSQEVEAREEKIEDGALLQVYPNPVTHFVTVEYQALTSGYLSINLLGISGKLVIQFQQEESLDVGEHRFQFDLSQLTAGVYFL
ncbi:MAG: T9SS type A sorting domain-containing protein, partial [Bacteroidota bacterium]